MIDSSCEDGPGAHDGPSVTFACPCRRYVRHTGYVGEPCSHVPFSDDAQHAAPAGPPHMTHRNHARCDGAVPPARPAGARSLIPRAGSSSEDQVQRESGEAETQASDCQGSRRTDHLEVRKWQRVLGRQGDHLYQSRAFRGGCVPGATDWSMPLGSANVPREQISFPVQGKPSVL